VLAGALLLQGCYSYHSVETPAPAIGEQVRVELTGAGQDRLRDNDGLLQSEVAGTVLSSSPEEIALLVHLDGERLGFGQGAFVDTLNVARTDARDIGVRTFSRGRTALAVLAGIGVVAGAFQTFTADKSGTGTPDPGTEFDGISIIEAAKWLRGGGG